MIYQIPLQAKPNQTVSFTLGGENVDIDLRTGFKGNLYITVSVNGINVVNSRICKNICPIMTALYLPVKGNLFFVDTQGLTDPKWQGLSDRYKLAWIDSI